MKCLKNEKNKLKMAKQKLQREKELAKAKMKRNKKKNKQKLQRLKQRSTQRCQDMKLRDPNEPRLDSDSDRSLEFEDPMILQPRVMETLLSP